MNKVIISTVGSSLITNKFSGEERNAINIISNLTEDELNKDGQNFEITEKVNKKNFIDIENFETASAELNGIIKYYGNLDLMDKTDMHILLHTDTYIGEFAAEKIKEILNKAEITNVYLQKIKSLNTKNSKEFNQGIKELFTWCYENVPLYKNKKYEIIFNLTGGFKSLQGYMSIAGMFYADKVVYVFETGKEIIEIPKLPIELKKGNMKEYITEYLYAATDICPIELIQNIPDIYLDKEDKFATLSPVGQLAWNQFKDEILSIELANFINIEYLDSFKKDFKDKKRDIIKLQETLAKVSLLLLQNNDDISVLKKDGGLQYENYTNKKENNEPIGHFRVTQETRVNCVFKNNKLFLRHFGPHDYVNTNP
ncbi:CRISPR-associated protein [Dysgonamonadaceae bacterium]|nr:CRISPR-associated protein [Dysgonamonadaceae bacterium]